jgi:hypothetical protein
MAAQTPLTEREKGIVIGLLVGQGSFGGDGKAPHVILKMHVRHERLMRWLAERIPRSKLYGPYHHGDRHFFQWVARGPALAVDLMPLLEEAAGLDAHAAERIAAMRENYAPYIARMQARDAL